MIKHEVICDNCRRDITYTNNCVHYRLTLRDEQIDINPDCTAVTAMFMHPWLDRPMHFCGTPCLKNWAMSI